MSTMTIPKQTCLPMCGGRHRTFRIDTDKATKTFAEALVIAGDRAASTGHRQHVTKHVGWIFRSGVWLVQPTTEETA